MNQIKIGVILSYLTIAFSIISGVLYTPWMIKEIGVSDYGLYVLITSFLSYFLVDFGLGQAISRYLALYKSENKIEKINQFLSITTKVYLVISVIIAIVLGVTYFFLNSIFVNLNILEIQKFKIIYLIAGCFSVISFPFLCLDGIFLAYEKFIILKLCDFLNKLALVVVMFIALTLGYKLYALVAINSIIGLLIILYKLYYLKSQFSFKINFSNSDKSVVKELIAFSFWTTIIGIAQRLLFNLAPVILGIVSGTSQIAIFSIANIIEGYTWTLAHALNGLFLSKIAQLQNNENSVEEVTKLMIKVGRFQLFLMGLVFIGIITLGKQFINLWMGTQFTDAYLIVLLLVLPSFISLTQEIAQTYLVVVNELKYRAIIFITASVISVIISFVLAPNYGALGCGIGIFTATLLCHVIGMNIIYYKILKINVIQFFITSFTSFLLPFTLALIFGFSMPYFITINSWFLFAFAGVLLSVFYVIVTWFLALEKEEKVYFIENVFYKFIKK